MGLGLRGSRGLSPEWMGGRPGLAGEAKVWACGRLAEDSRRGGAGVSGREDQGGHRLPTQCWGIRNVSRTGRSSEEKGRKEDGWKVGREESALEPESEDAGGRISGGSGKERTAAIWGGPGSGAGTVGRVGQPGSERGRRPCVRDRLGRGPGMRAQKVRPSPKLSGCQKGGEQGTCGRKV